MGCLLLCLFETHATHHRIHTHTHTPTHTRRHTDTQTHRHTDTQTHRHTEKQTHRHTDNQTNRHTHTLDMRQINCKASTDKETANKESRKQKRSFVGLPSRCFLMRRLLVRACITTRYEQRRPVCRCRLTPKRNKALERQKKKRAHTRANAETASITRGGGLIVEGVGRLVN